MEKNKTLTKTELEQKEKSKRRLTVLLVCIDILLVTYLIYQIITVFSN